MKSIYLLLAFAAAVICSVARAESTVQVAEPVKCYQLAWASVDKGGLGLSSGQAVELCSGAKDARKVLQCYAQAWLHPDNGGLGLIAGMAIDLCKTKSAL